MGIFDARDILAYPGGDNATDVLIGGVNFNLTTLKHWNYTLYTNGTLSNWSNCFVTFEPYTPVLLANGTFLNTTSCYSPLKDIGKRAIPGIAIGVFFGISLVFTMINLRKHGRLFLPSEKRFHAVGRRWQWYWMTWVAGCGMASGFTSVDVDRYYLPEWPLILNCIFWYLMIPSTVAVVWESVRHWGSWMERQIIDPNPFMLSQNDKRGRTEFYMPLVFYAFAFLHFFMSVPRNWTPVFYQRSPSQTQQQAEPQATDGRFKAGAIFLFLAWCTIVFSLRHSLHHYTPRHHGPLTSFIGFFRQTPFNFLLTIPLTLVIVGYQFAVAFSFPISPLNNSGQSSYIYGLGYGPIVLIFVIQEVWGYLHPNEDRELIRQRRVRGAIIDEEMGYTRKPPWWRRLNGAQNLSMQQAIARNAAEISGSPDAKLLAENGQEVQDMEMTTLPRNEGRVVRVDNTPAGRASARRETRTQELTEERMMEAAKILFPPPPERKKTDPNFLMSDDIMDGAGRGRPLLGVGGSGESTVTAVSDRSPSTASVATTATTMAGAQPQVVRSMLDI